MSKVFEDKYRQKLIALIADNGYNLGTNFEWNKVSDLKGQKLAGAGLNLKWLEFAGATPVQSSLPDAYTAMQTGVYNGWIMFPSGWVNFKLFEVGKYYTEIGFGAITWHGLTINKARFDKLPKEVQDIILEVAKEYEAMTGTVNKANYPKQLEELKAKGTNVRKLPGQRAGRLGEVARGLAAKTRPRNWTHRACRRHRCWRPRSRRRKRTATNGRCATRSNKCESRHAGLCRAWRPFNPAAGTPMAGTSPAMTV